MKPQEDPGEALKLLQVLAASKLQAWSRRKHGAGRRAMGSLRGRLASGVALGVVCESTSIAESSVSKTQEGHAR